MDGTINLKIDQLKNFLSVRGITDGPVAGLVGDTFTKRAFPLGLVRRPHPVGPRGRRRLLVGRLRDEPVSRRRGA